MESIPWNPRPVFSPSLEYNFSIPRGALTKGPSLQDPQAVGEQGWETQAGLWLWGRQGFSDTAAGWVGVKPEGSISQAIKLCFFMGYSNCCWITNYSGDWYLKMGLL